MLRMPWGARDRVSLPTSRLSKHDFRVLQNDRGREVERAHANGLVRFEKDNLSVLPFEIKQGAADRQRVHFAVRHDFEQRGKHGKRSVVAGDERFVDGGGKAEIAVDLKIYGRMKGEKVWQKRSAK